jgi:hypothetical protein
LTNFMVRRLRRHADAQRRWPGYLLGGHMRTSTVVLILAFAVAWFVYNDHRDSTKSTPTQEPATQVVPPGFVPDPNYTWVPRSRVQAPPTTVTVTPTPTPTTTTPPPFNLPTIPLPPPFGQPTTTSSPAPGPAPAPPAAAPFPGLP